MHFEFFFFHFLLQFEQVRGKQCGENPWTDSKHNKNILHAAKKNKFVRQRRGEERWGGYLAHPIPRTPTASRSLGNQVFENTVSRERIRVDNSSGRRVVQSHAGPCGPRRGARCCACKSLPANKLRHAAEKAEISGSCFSPSLFLFQRLTLFNRLSQSRRKKGA